MRVPDRVVADIAGTMKSGSTCHPLLAKLRETDKRKHFWVCFCLQLVFLPWLPLLESVGLALLIGTLKECWDQRYGSGFCWYDMLANILGIVAGVIAYVLLCSVWAGLT